MHTFEELRREHDDSRRVFARRMPLLLLVIMPVSVGLLIVGNWVVLPPLRERSQALYFAVGGVGAIALLIGVRTAAKWTFAPFEKPAFCCPQCGKNLNLETCSCDDAITDPRWDALKDLRSKLQH